MDLSTFLVHLTRDYRGTPARQNLEGILHTLRLEARTPYSAALRTLQQLGATPRDYSSQRCVCFTETPLEHLNLLLAPISDLQRQCEYRPYGIAITKRIARDYGVNPVWYTDITPGHTWLMNSVNALIDEALQHVVDARSEGDDAACFGDHAIARLTPFIEQMGSGEGYRKEFWWEREWRHVGHFPLPLHFIVIAPESEHDDLSQLVPGRAAFIDSDWGIEEIIGRLAGFTEVQVGPNV
jgi:hypothetical protein